MARSKIDGVIETARYAPDGTLSLVRMYQRRNQAWSDIVLLDRAALVALLKNGRKILTGTRKPGLGGMFETKSEVHLTNDHVITEGQASARDLLAGVPVF
jgi:hypothetical protein